MFVFTLERPHILTELVQPNAEFECLNVLAVCVT